MNNDFYSQFVNYGFDENKKHDITRSKQYYRKTNVSQTDEFITKRLNIELGHILPTSKDIEISNKMVNYFLENIETFKHKLRDKELINFVIYISEIISKIFDNICESGNEKLTYGVFKHFYNILLRELDSEGINIANSHLAAQISTINKEARVNNKLFDKEIFIENLLKYK